MGIGRGAVSAEGEQQKSEETSSKPRGASKLPRLSFQALRPTTFVIPLGFRLFVEG